MSGGLFGGVAAERDGDGWVLREADRPAGESSLGRLAHAADGLRITDGPVGLPAGPYGSVDAAIEAVQTWRSARFDGDRS